MNPLCWLFGHKPRYEVAAAALPHTDPFPWMDGDLAKLADALLARPTAPGKPLIPSWWCDIYTYHGRLECARGDALEILAEGWAANPEWRRRGVLRGLLASYRCMLFGHQDEWERDPLELIWNLTCQDCRRVWRRVSDRMARAIGIVM